MPGDPGLDGGSLPDPSRGQVHLGLGEAGFASDLVHPLPAHTHHLGDLGDAHQVIGHDPRIT
jgi:hypothetical protein